MVQHVDLLSHSLTHLHTDCLLTTYQDLDKCATAVRGATMAKIVPGSLQS